MLRIFGLITIGLCINGGASLDMLARNCHTASININSANAGGSCYHECEVEGLKDDQYIAITKTVIYHHYDKTRSYGPSNFFSTETGFVEEVNNTGRYENSTTNPYENKVFERITFTNAIPGDSGNFTCEVRSKVGDTVINGTVPLPLVIKGTNLVKLQFGKREPATEGRNIVVEEIYESGEDVEVDDEDYGDLVYIVNITDVVSTEPIFKLTDKKGAADNWFNFTSTWHNFTDNPDTLIPIRPTDVTYLYHPKSACQDVMHLEGRYAVGDDIQTVELMIDADECNSALKASGSAILMISAFVFLINLYKSM